MRSEASDEELVARVQRGDAGAFAAIYERHSRRLGLFLRSCGVPEADVDDLLGETFCRALNRVQQFDLRRGKRYLAYLYAIDRNLAADSARGRAPVTSLADVDEDREPSDSVRTGLRIRFFLSRARMCTPRRRRDFHSP